MTLALQEVLLSNSIQWHSLSSHHQCRHLFQKTGGGAGWRQASSLWPAQASKDSTRIHLLPEGNNFYPFCSGNGMPDAFSLSWLILMGTQSNSV